VAAAAQVPLGQMRPQVMVAQAEMVLLRQLLELQ
jgi:hypothetical protein